jgi:hypothetical protein
MLRVNTKPRHRNSPRIAEKSAPAFLQWLRGRECLFEFLGGCDGRMEAAHVDYAGGKGMATKVADRFAVPACSIHHKRQTDMGWKQFEGRLIAREGFALRAAERYWRAWPGRIAWERKQETERG